MSEQTPLRLPIVSAGAEFLVMGNLMRRNVLTYKAPQNHEGYDLICIHPNPRHHQVFLGRNGVGSDGRAVFRFVQPWHQYFEANSRHGSDIDAGRGQGTATL